MSYWLVVGGGGERRKVGGCGRRDCPLAACARGASWVRRSGEVQSRDETAVNRDVGEGEA